MTLPDLQDPDAVIRLFREAADANRDAACRRGSIDLVHAPGRLIATGDLHDNPLHLAGVVEAAGMGEATPEHRPEAGATGRGHRPESGATAHLTLHEIIHSDKLIHGMDFSHRALARVAQLKIDHPEHIHTLLANHELAQIVGQGIVKDGVRVAEAFDQGVEYVFADAAAAVGGAIAVFIKSMPLALRCVCPGGDILCAHSLPPPELMSRFDPGVLERELTDEDYEPRRGSAHLMVWGRGYDAELLEDLVERWGVNLFILGHEKAEDGVRLVEPNAVILNSDHERGVYLPIDLDDPPSPSRAVASVVRLSG